MSQPRECGYAPVNGVDMYWESYGAGGTPVLVVHGGYGVIGAMTELIARLSEAGQVVAVELQGHGHTRDIDRPLRYEALGDDLAALVEHTGAPAGPAPRLLIGGGCLLASGTPAPCPCAQIGDRFLPLPS
jgi:pimeloyl-ACP methyl ester carboxylesterase